MTRMDKNLRTCIIVTKETRQKLKDIGRKCESYDEIVMRLLEEHQPVSF